MSVYFLITYDITDAEGYEAYVPGVVPLLHKHGGEIVVADYDVERMEGKRRDVNVVLRFDSEEAARGWYEDPAYEPIKQIRLDATETGTFVLAKEFTMPPSA